MLNILDLEPGAKVRLKDDAIAEVVANPKDGVWIEGLFSLPLELFLTVPVKGCEY